MSPVYEFKCHACNKNQEAFLSFSEHRKSEFGKCKKCGKSLLASDQQINFAGTVNMNASAMGINQRTYNNKQGGPHGIIGGTYTGKATAKKGGLNIGPTGL